MKFQSEFKHFHSRKCTSKCRLRKGVHFVSASMPFIFVMPSDGQVVAYHGTDHSYLDTDRHCVPTIATVNTNTMTPVIKMVAAK